MRFVLLALVLGFANGVYGSEGKMDVDVKAMGKTADGIQVDVYTLTNIHGLKARIMTYGATLIGMETPDRQGRPANITLHLETLDDYLAGHPFFGSVAGRYANRIAAGRFTLDGQQYALPINNGANHLHGGPRGFDKAVWKARAQQDEGSASVELVHVSPDGDAGYPGKLTAKVVYSLTRDDRLVMDYTATTDKPTVVNLTNHAYWNLGGIHRGDVLGHVLMIRASRYLPVDDGLIPTGELAPVAGTPMDFNQARPIGQHLAQVKGGYDHCYVLDKAPGEELSLAARVEDSQSGRWMEIYTTQPGIQFYTGNFLDGSKRAEGVAYTKHYGFCLETEHFPDSPNRPEFPSTVLRPGQTYRETTIHKFGVK